MRYSGTIDDLGSLMTAAIELDDGLYELAMDKKHDKSNLGRAETWQKANTDQ